MSGSSRSELPPDRAASPLVLASRSPQRTAILAQLGIAHEVVPADIPERDAGEPAAVATANAVAKAQAVAGRFPDRLVVGVDTIVVADSEIFGKPATEGDARGTLRLLEGRSHTVISGLATVLAGKAQALHETTEVTFRALSHAEVDAYVATGEWCGRAGGYAIQGKGAALVRGLRGDYLNVVGLPVGALLDLHSSLILRSW